MQTSCTDENKDRALEIARQIHDARIATAGMGTKIDIDGDDWEIMQDALYLYAEYIEAHQ